MKLANNTTSKTIIAIIAIFLLSSFSGNGLRSYSVVELTKFSAREVEDMGSFNIEGKVGGSLNIGFLKCFKLHDIQYDKYYVLVTSPKKSLPTENSIVKMKVELFSEYRLNDNSLKVLTELK